MPDEKPKDPVDEARKRGEDAPRPQDPMEDHGTGSDPDGSEAAGSGPSGGENDPTSGGGTP